jgi:cytochrome c peroxidase
VFKLPGDLGYDAGRNVFHMQTKSGLACASCHPEGRDDGLIWTFAEFGTRRSQNLSGGILNRAPYHWTGDKPDLNNLMDDVFAVRMGGGTPTDGEKLAIGPFLDRLPAPAAEAGLDPAAVARGKAIFQSDTAKCATCHADELMTNNSLQDVGTGGKFKVPSLLGVGARPPFMHNGCAATLKDRFNPACGGGDKHGVTSQLSANDIDDLTTYLNSL